MATSRFERSPASPLLGLTLSGVLALFMLVLGCRASEAQQVSAAMRQACMADIRALCGDVQPGGGRKVTCLKQNASRVSAPCQKALASLKEQQ